MTHQNTVFAINKGDRFHIQIKVLGADRCLHYVDCMKKITILSDTGNDITLLTTSTARNLGFDPQTMTVDATGKPTETFPVAGITDSPQLFRRIWNLIQLGDLRPCWVRMGLAFKEESLAENLLGKLDILDNGRYEVSYTNETVTYSERHVHVNAGLGETSLPYDLRESFRDIK